MSLAYRLARPVLRALDPERAHQATLLALRTGLAPVPKAPADSPLLAIDVLGHNFANPVGLAAGFDKNADVPDPMLRMGFSFVEVGTVTPKPQAGNPRPRVFRLDADGAVINRLGFPSRGFAAVKAKMEARRARGGIVGVNVGANKLSLDWVADYEDGIRIFGPLASFLTVNISSPNTPGLRGLQQKEQLDLLLGRCVAARNALKRRVPLLLKIAPDLDAVARQDVAAQALAHAIDGLIVSNTTIERAPGLKSPRASETGGLSGAPLREPSTALLADMARLTQGRLVLIGVGGIASGAHAYAKIRAGASLVQLYTALTYRGPELISEIKRDIAALLRRDGMRSLRDAVGADHR